MKLTINQENKHPRAELSRVELDRELRDYRKLASVLRSSGSYGKSFGGIGLSEGGAIGTCTECGMDEAALHSRMYALRALILSVEDVRERLLLYDYYIKGMTLERCAKALGVSRRTVYRLKAHALDSVAEIKLRAVRGS